MDPDDMLEKALAELRVSYKAHVKDLAKDILDDVKRGHIENREDLDTRVHETVDGDGWVIYIRKAQVVLLCSDHDGEAVSEGLVDTPDFRDGVPWSKLAYGAMEADLREVMGRLEDEYGFDIDADDLGIEEHEDEDGDPPIAGPRYDFSADIGPTPEPDDDEEPESDPSP